MRRQIISQTARRSDPTLCSRPWSQISDLANQNIDLLLLADDVLVEFVEQVFGEAGLDLEVGQALFHVVGLFHGSIGHHVQR